MNNNFLPYQLKKTNDSNEALASQLAEKAKQPTNESTASDGLVLTANGDGTSTFKAPPVGGGGGDMLKSTYDANNDGKVDHAENADSVDWSGVTNKPIIPSAYTLPTASSTVLGGVKIGSGISVDANGVISASGGGGSSAPTNVYEIELSRWGITQGLPTKPYTSANFTTANNNITGINNALSWAYTNGYNYVVLPRGQYSICYPNPINTQPTMTIDFNGSTLKVIYDSVNRSPLDISSNPVWKFGGDSIVVTTPNTHIKNLVLIGDRIDRSWVNDGTGNERSMESTNGVKFAAGAHNSSIRYSNISYYMGDAIALYFQPSTTMGSMRTEFGSFNTSGAQITGVTSNSVRTITPISIPNGVTSFSMIGLGYSPITTIPNQQYNVYFYNSSGTFISYKTNIRTRDLVQVPANATTVNLSWEGSGTIDGGAYGAGGASNPANPPYYAILIQNGVADNVQVEYNEIHRCHRGGMFLGTDNALIRRNYFHDTGAPDNMDIDGLPQFTDGTRYCIDTEDNVGQNCKILENVFENSNLGVCLRGEYNDFSMNEIRNCPTGLKLYSLKNINVEKNYFYYSAFSDYSWNNYDRDWQINNNVFNNSSIGFNGTGIISSISDNFFGNNSTFSSSVEVFKFKGNVFNNSSATVTEQKTIYDSCIFYNGSKLNVILDTSTVYDRIIACKFINGSYIMAQSLAQIIVRDSHFRDGYVYYNTNALKITINNCKVTNQNYPFINNPTAGFIVNYTLEIINGSNISLGLNAPTWKKSTTYTNDVNNSYASVIVPSTYNGFYYKCITAGTSGSTEPTWSTTAGTSVTDGGATWQTYAIPKCPLLYAYNWGDLTIKDSTIVFNVYSPYTKVLLDNYGDFTGAITIKNSTITTSPSTSSNNASKATTVYIDSKSALSGFSLISPAGGIQSDSMTTIPNTGVYSLGQTILNSNPTAGQYLGWVCTLGGTACNTIWGASTSYAVGNTVYSGTSIYQVTQAGTSGKTVPTFPPNLNDTVTDNNGLTTPWVSGKAYVVGDIVVPTTPNGYYYKCSIAGTSGTTEPAWSIYGSRTYDNSVGWDMNKYVTWKNIGAKATFNPYGLISS